MNDTAPHNSTSADRRRVIIIDDNYAVADGLKWLLETAGHDVVGMASTIETAMKLVASTDCDVAILDIDLHGITTDAVAYQLLSRATPFMFITGFSDVVQMPEAFDGIPRLEKPADPDEILQTIVTLSPTPA